MIKGFIRTDNQFSLCGLNCGLCPYQLQGNCPGCFADSPCARICPIAPCSVKHGNVQYCFECEEYPCDKYDGIDKYDSLISHKNQKRDLAKAKQVGIENYLEEQTKKRQILIRLLNEYDDGKQDVFFCLAVNLMELNDLYTVIEEADSSARKMPLSEKAALVKQMLITAAKKKNITLELRR